MTSPGWRFFCLSYSDDDVVKKGRPGRTFVSLAARRGAARRGQQPILYVFTWPVTVNFARESRSAGWPLPRGKHAAAGLVNEDGRQEGKGAGEEED